MMQFDLSRLTSLSPRGRPFAWSFIATQLPLLAYLAWGMFTSRADIGAIVILMLASAGGVAIALTPLMSEPEEDEPATEPAPAFLDRRRGAPQLRIGPGDEAPAPPMAKELYIAMENAVQIDDFNIAMHEDATTGLANRRGFLAQVEALPAAKRQGCMVLIEIDHCDQIVEHMGQHEYHRILGEFAARLSSQTRRVDIVCRWGGERFAIFYQDCIDDEASWSLVRIAERIRQEPLGEVNGRAITFSAGLCRWRGEPVPATIERARGALQKAGQLGRNRVQRAEQVAVEDFD